MTISQETQARITLQALRQMRDRRESIAMLTCYDYSSARILDAAGVPILLVGDSAANTMLGLKTTRDIPPEFLMTITAAVRRGAPRAFVLADLPFQVSGNIDAAKITAKRFLSECGADAVKVEVTGAELPLVEALVSAGVPICAHLGLLPQRVTTPNGYRAQGRTKSEAEKIIADAIGCSKAGAAMILLEAVPDEVTHEVVAKTNVPVIGCGAGPSAHGHVIVLHDILGFNEKPPRFAEVLADVPEVLREAAQRYLGAIASRSYPAEKHQYHMKAE